MSEWGRSSAPYGTASWDRDGAITSCDQGFADLVGFATPRELHGLPADALWHTTHPGPDEEILRTGYQLVTRRTHRTGRWLYLVCRMHGPNNFSTQARVVTATCAGALKPAARATT